MRKVLLWLWPKIRAIYGWCELRLDLLDQRIIPGSVASRPEAAAGVAGATPISGAHGHGTGRGARVAGGHVLLVALLCAATVQAAPSPAALGAVHNAFRGFANPFRMGEPLASYDPQSGGSQGGPSFRFDGSYNLLVNCITGCSASSGFTDNSIFTVGSSTINPIGALYSTSTPSISSGNAGRVRMDANSYLLVDCITGCSASGGFADNSAFTAGTTPVSITGGWYSSSPTNCTSGNACAPQLTADRKLFVQDFQGTSPWVVSNGGTFAVQAAQSGTWTVQQGGAPWSMVGTLTNNNAAPGSNNLGVLPCLVGSAPSPTSGDLNTLSCDTSGNVRVVVPGSVAVTGTFWQSTQPVSAASLPLPSGASTAANQCGAAVGSPCMLGGEGTSAAIVGQITCDHTAIQNGITASTQLVAASGSTKVYVCGFYVNGASTTLNTVKLQYGTGTTCGTGTNDFSLAIPIQAPSSIAPAGSNITYSSNTVKATPASQALCVSLSAAQAVNVEVEYTQF